MKDYESSSLETSIRKLADNEGDTLRAAQRIMANLASIESQREAIDYVVEFFTGLSQAQRLTVLETVESHLDQERFPCLALRPNQLIILDVLSKLREAISGTEGGIFKKPKHGTPAEVREVVGLAGRIEGKARAVALPEKELEIPPIRLKTFIESLDDDLLDRLMMLMTRIRDIKACRDSSYQVVEGRFEREVIRSEDSYTGVLASITSDFYDFIKNETVVLNILKGMDFRELTMLLNYLEYFRAEKFMQGMVRGQ